MEIDATCLPLDVARSISDVLRDVSNVDTSGRIDPAGRWLDTIERLVVRRPIAGGRSGAIVVDANVFRAGFPLPERRVVKIGPIEDIAQEWKAFRAALHPRRSSRLIVAVDAVSTAIDQADHGLPDLLAAISYHHVSEHAHRPDDDVVDLEQLANGADAGPAIEVIKVLTDRLRTGLWIGDKPQAQTLRRFNHELGVDLEVEVDGVTARGLLTFGAPTLEQRRSMVRTSDEVLDAATRLDPGGSGPIAIGAMVELRSIAPVRVSSDLVEGRLGDVTIQIRPADGANLDLSRHVDLDRPKSLVVVGRVVGTRIHRWWQRVLRFAPASTIDSDAMELAGIRVRQPFARLGDLITAVVPDRLVGMTHGDLNPRNVLMVDDLVYLIDFARAGNRPPMSDAAFLEVCLLRDTVAARLGWARTVRLQRLLGVAARAAAAAGDEWDPGQSLITGDAELDQAFRLCWAVRAGARRWSGERRGWWREYLAQLTLASIRTLKWTDDRQTAASVCAVVAAAGVAAEWLGTDPYRFWPDAELRWLVARLVQDLDPRSLETGDVLAGLVTALDRRAAGERDEAGLLEAIGRCRDAFLRSHFHETARAVRVERDVAHAEYISLRALPGRRVDAPRDPDGPADRLAAVTAPLEARDAVDAAATHESPLVVILGESGSGKTTVARELQYRLASAVLNPHASAPLVPVTLMAPDVNRALDQVAPADVAASVRVTARALLSPTFGDQAEAILELGGAHLTIDALNELEASQRTRVVEWIRALHEVFRRTRVVVCHRVNGFVRQELPFPILHLQKVSDQQARGYVRDRFKALGLPDYEEQAAALIRVLLDDEINAPVRDLAQTPLFLWMIVARYADEHRLPAQVGDLFREFTSWSLQSREHAPASDRNAGRPFEYARCVAALELLARHLFDHGNVTDLPVKTAIRLLRASEPDPHALLDYFVDADMLVRAGGILRFRLHSFQEYFAALTLRREEDTDRAAFVDRVLTFSEREALQIMFRFAGGSPELARDLVDVAIQADPVFAAQLLRWIEAPAAHDVRRFLDAQERTLLEDSGDLSWRAAVSALNELGTDDARQLLQHVAVHGRGGAAAGRPGRSFVRAAALAALLRMRSATRFERARPALDREATDTVLALLGDHTAAELRIEAINAVSDGRLTSLVAYLAGLIRRHQPWPVLRAACRSLISLGQILEPGQQTTYVAACAARLPGCEADLQHAIDDATVTELHDEWWELVEVLTAAGRLDLVLPVRFAFGRAADLYWSEWADGVRDIAGIPEVARPAWDALRAGQDDPRADFAEGDELVAIAAAHQMLAQHDPGAGDLIGLVDRDSPPAKLLAAAATVPQLDAAGQTQARALATELIDTLTPEHFEPLAAILTGLPPEEFDTKRMLLTAMVAFRRGYPEARNGPLERLFFDSHRWTSAEIADTVLASDEGRELVLHGFSMILYVHDGRRPQHPDLVPDAVDMLERYEPTSFAERLRYVKAGTAAGLVSTLGPARELALDPDAAEAMVTTANRRYGFGQVAALGEVLACIGYLGRRAFDTGHHPASQAAYEFLDGYSTAGQHATVERGRLVGLAVLGDWSPLLSALWTGDRPMHRAARNAVDLWTPGPYTPNWGTEPEDIATWIGARVRAEGARLAPDVRSTLCETKALIERNLGHIIVPD